MPISWTVELGQILCGYRADRLRELEFATLPGDKYCNHRFHIGAILFPTRDFGNENAILIAKLKSATDQILERTRQGRALAVRRLQIREERDHSGYRTLRFGGTSTAMALPAAVPATNRRPLGSHESPMIESPSLPRASSASPLVKPPTNRLPLE
jgi:hypothetical protein